MVDYSKLGKGSWCVCCSNQHIYEAAEQIIEKVAQDYYEKPMCIGSLALALSMAAEHLNYVYAGKAAHDAEKELGIPFQLLRVIMTDVIMAKMQEEVAEANSFASTLDQEREVRTLRMLVSMKELRDADAAFDKAHPAKGD